MQWRSFLRRLFRPKRQGEIAPDEVLLDATNLPQFDENQFEGRIERSLSKKTFLYFGMVSVLVVVIFTGRVFLLQVVEGEEYVKESENNRLEHSFIFADRGIIYDRNGEELAWNTLNNEDPFSKRIYREGGGNAHVIGYVGYPLKDTHGVYYQEEFVAKGGIEQTFNETIKGENGLKIIETNALREVRSESVVRPPSSGEDLELSIDIRITNELYRLMQERAEGSGFTGGAGVIMDIHTGEILALSNFPEYDSNLLTEGGVEALQEYVGDERKPFLNRAVSGLYAPGSIIKPFIAVGVLEEEIINPHKQILSTGALVLPNPYFPDNPSVFKDWKAHGLVDLRRALAVSSDEYFYVVGGGYKDQQGLGIENIEKYVRMFGFGSETGAPFLGEAVGTIPNPAWKEATFDDVWRVGNTYHTSIGQYGFQVTPVQAVRATAVLANNGTLVTPTLVKGESSRGERLPLDKNNLQIVREGMRMAVTDGTAKGLLLPQVTVAGKTGTAELGAAKEYVNSWVTGFFPYENPRYAFVVLMERGPRKNTVGALWVMANLIIWMGNNTPEYFVSE